MMCKIMRETFYLSFQKVSSSKKIFGILLLTIKIDKSDNYCHRII